MPIDPESITKAAPERSVLHEAFGLVNGDRAEAYGDPYDDYKRVTDLFRLMTGHELTPTDGVLFMECVKLGRIAHNHQRGEYHRDSVVDSCGYWHVYTETAKGPPCG